MTHQRHVADHPLGGIQIQYTVARAIQHSTVHGKMSLLGSLIGFLAAMLCQQTQATEQLHSLTIDDLTAFTVLGHL